MRLVPAGDTTSLGPAIFAFLAAGEIVSVSAGQDALCHPFETFMPDPAENQVYERLYPLFRKAYFGLGRPEGNASLGDLLPTLRLLAARRRADALASVSASR